MEIYKVSKSEDVYALTSKFICEYVSGITDRRLSIALSGGRTPKGVFSVLVSEYKEKIDWSRIDFFWTDERCVHPDNYDSNYKLANDNLFKLINEIPLSSIYRMRGEIDPELASQEYEELIKSYFLLAKTTSAFPEFDIMLLGVGADGHTASLFPDTSSLYEKNRLVVESYNKQLDSRRITLTFPVINNARKRIIMATGKEKWPVIKSALFPAKTKTYPINNISDVHGESLWLVDAELFK